MEVATVDYHTAGEPFRIVLSGAPEIAGATVRERRQRAILDERVQSVRRLLCNEPRGHADMYGGLLVPADDEGADLGVLFWHKDGFSTACGHGSIALAVWAVETGRVPSGPDGDAEVRIDVPSGRVAVRVECRDGRPRAAIFRNVPAYVLARGVEVAVDERRLLVDFAYGGAIYVSLAAAQLDLAVRPERLGALIAAAREIKSALADHDAARHPSDGRLSGIYGVVFHDDLGAVRGGRRQRNVTVFADGEVDRSPCGSATSARVALLEGEGLLGPGAVLFHESIIGTEFRARVAARTEAEGRAAVLTEVEGIAHRTGEHRFTLDPADTLGTGFLLR